MIALTPACDWNHKSVPALANIPVTFIGQSASIELHGVEPNMKIVSLVSLAFATFGAWLFRAGLPPTQASVGRVTVLVELFTAEGCSSCPPADAFLHKIDHDPAISVSDISVLSYEG